MQLLAARSSYVGATIETDALALAAGAWLAGKKTAVFCQNSGLGNLVNPLSSLNEPFGIPTLLVLGWRGKPGEKDEPQHLLMGRTTRQILGLMDVACFELPKEPGDAHRIIAEAFTHIDATGKSAALLVGPNSFEPLGPVPTTAGKEKEMAKRVTALSSYPSGQSLVSRYEMLQAIDRLLPGNAAVVATTGKCGRELNSLHDSEQHFYMVGSMGSASAIGLGAALHTKKPVVVLDGDGAALMRLGTMATIGRMRCENLTHIILDNQAHDSTGGQPTGSDNIDFPGIAAACGYATASQCLDPAGASDAISSALATPGPHLIHIRIRPGSVKNLGRPETSPSDVARRFRKFLDSA